MTLTKTLLIISTVGFLAACEEGATPMAGGGASSGGIDAALVPGSLAGKLEVASASGNTVTYGYYTDVVGEGDVISASDTYCGAGSFTVLNIEGTGLVRGEKNGRGYNTMTFVCS